jgi:hypothetical protein
MQDDMTCMPVCLYCMVPTPQVCIDTLEIVAFIIDH